MVEDLLQHGAEVASLIKEKELVGMILSDKKQIDKALGKIDQRFFVDEVGGRIFGVVRDLKEKGEPFGKENIISYMLAGGFPQEVVSLMEECCLYYRQADKTPEEIVKDVELLHSRVRIRKAVEKTLEETHDFTLSNDEILTNLFSNINSIPLNGTLRGFKDGSSVAMRAYEKLKQKPKIDMNFCGLGFLIRPLFGEEYCVLAGEPSAGKTSLAINLLSYQVKKGKKVLFVSYDDSEESLYFKLCCMECGVRLDTLRKDNKTAKEWDDINAAFGKLSDLGFDKRLFHLDGHGIPMESLSHRIKTQVDVSGADLIIIDYLQNIGSKNPRLVDSETAKVQYVSTVVDHLCGTLKVPILLLSQMNREGRKDKDGSSKDKRFKTHWLKGSSQIEQDANLIIGLLDIERSEETGFRRIRVDVCKQKDGPIGYHDLFFEQDLYKFHGDGLSGY